MRKYQSTDDVLARAGLPQDWQPTASQIPQDRVPLTAAQHILHLLATVFTAGLWLPVWIVLAARGNRVTVTRRSAG